MTQMGDTPERHVEKNNRKNTLRMKSQDTIMQLDIGQSVSSESSESRGKAQVESVGDLTPKHPIIRNSL